MKKQRELREYEINHVAGVAMCARASVRKYFREPERMHASTRERIERALRELGLLGPSPAAVGAK